MRAGETKPRWDCSTPVFPRDTLTEELMARVGSVLTFDTFDDMMR